MNRDLEHKNRCTMVGWTTIILVLAAAYLLEVVKHTRTLEYVILYEALALTPLIIGHIIYKKNKGSKTIKYLCAYSYIGLYMFTLLTTTATMAFVYVLPILCVLLVYNDKKTLLFYGGVALLALIGQWVIVGKGGALTLSSADMEIQFFGILLSVIFSQFTITATSNINRENLQQIMDEEERQKLITDKIIATTKIVSKNTSEINEQIGNLLSSSEDTKCAMDQIAEGTNNTAESIELQRDMTEDIQKIIQSVLEEADEITSDTEKTTENVIQGLKQIDLLNESAEQTKSNSQIVKEQMDKLVSVTEEVKGIVEIINNIATETNLLALNASIEAARAGEAGKGFAVVAGEINGLAAQTQTAIEQIEKLIGELQKQTASAGNGVGKMTQLALAQNEAIFETEKTFTYIKEAIDKVATSVKIQNGKLDELSVANRNIVESIQTISSVSEEVTANTQITSELVDKNVDATNDVKQMVFELNETMLDLNKTIAEN